MTAQPYRRFLFCSLAVLVLIVSGCSQLSTDYGKSRGSTGRKSLNGFGALRKSYEQADFSTRDVSRLTNRVKRTDVIVWTPRVFGSASQKVNRWFESWLKSGNKTLIYVVPDSGSEADYWIEAGKVASPKQRVEYRKRAARSINERMLWRLNRTGRVLSNGWFRIEPLEKRIPLGQIATTETATTKNAAAETDDLAAIEFAVLPYKPDAPTPPPATGGGTAATPAPAGPVLGSGPTGPSSPGWSNFTPAVPSRVKTEFDPIVTASDGSTAVAIVRSDQWRDSKIIVVAGGSLLTNFALSRRTGRTLAEDIIARSTPAEVSDPKIGFLTSDWMPISVSETKPGAPIAAGIELMVWPISLVTMHGAMLGVVVCLMLLPIFGRPRRVRTSNHSDFGDHLDAVAALMTKAGGPDYARGRISEYHKRIRGETSGPWVLADQTEKQTSAGPLPSLNTKRPAAPAGTNQEQPLPSDGQPRMNAPDPASQSDPASQPGLPDRTDPSRSNEAPDRESS